MHLNRRTRTSRFSYLPKSGTSCPPQVSSPKTTPPCLDVIRYLTLQTPISVLPGRSSRDIGLEHEGPVEQWMISVALLGIMTFINYDSTRRMGVSPSNVCMRERERERE